MADGERGGIQISILSSQKEKPMPAMREGRMGVGPGGVVQETSHVEQTEVQGKGELGRVLGGEGGGGGCGDASLFQGTLGRRDQGPLELAESPIGCPVCPAVGETRGGKTGRYQDCF